MKFCKYTYFCLLLFCDIAATFKLGVENISKKDLKLLQNKRVGLITNQTGVTQKNVSTLDVLLEKNIDVRYLFVPEHGLEGLVDAGKTVKNVDLVKNNIPAISLYREGHGVSIAKKYLDKIDLFVFDIQDSGMRHYTYISTLYKALAIAAEHNKQFVVLDRPNPLGCMIEGPLVKEEFESFISIAPIPLRHGMTIGEIAQFCNEVLFEKKVDLHIVAMHKYNKNNHTFVLQQKLSPNIQSLQSIYGYSFLGLLGEIQPFDVGVGTSRAFSSFLISKDISVPLSLWQELHALFRSNGINVKFVSNYQGKQNKPSSGFLLSFFNVNKLHAFDLFLDIVDMFEQSDITLLYSPVFDKSVGTDWVRIALQEGGVALLRRVVQNELKKFYMQAKKIFLY